MPRNASKVPRLHPLQRYPGESLQGTSRLPDATIEPKPTSPTTIHNSIPTSIRVALAHDWLVGLRGGEMVLDAITQTIQSTSTLSATNLYTLFADSQPLTPALAKVPTRVSRLNALPASARRWLLPLYPAAVADLSSKLAHDHRRNPIDLLLSTSSVAAKAIAPPTGVPHLCYCHTPARYLWDQQHEYSKSGSRLQAAGLKLLGPKLRNWDKGSTNGITRLLANSSFTATRIQKCWGLEATVLHPPIDTEFFTPCPQTPRQDHWLVVSALEPYKRVDLAIDAAIQTNHPLVIVGTGSLSRSLRARCAGSSNITFHARVTRTDLRHLYRTARCLVFPQVEDFGMAAAEAQACGCPVVARSIGGAAEIVIEGKTGSLIQEPTPSSVIQAIQSLPEDCSSACTSNAQRFSATRFEISILKEIVSVLSKP